MTNPEPPEDIEVKFAVEPCDLTGVLKALPQVPGKGEEFTVHFFDREPILMPDGSHFPLFEKGLIIRERQRPSKVDDATFKVRGAGAVAALNAVGGATKDRKLEGDQNVGADVKVSFSITSVPPLAKIEDVLDGKVELRAALDADASKLMERADQSWSGVGVYGPIQAKRWKVEIPDVGEVTVELWKTKGIELLEVSGRVGDGKSQAEVEAAAKEFGDKLAAFMLAIPGVKQLLGEDKRPASKTEFALKNCDFRTLVTGPKV